MARKYGCPLRVKAASSNKLKRSVLKLQGNESSTNAREFGSRSIKNISEIFIIVEGESFHFLNQIVLALEVFY